MIRNLDNRRIGLKGTFESKIRMYGRIHWDRFYVVSDDKGCILEMNFISPLDIMVDPKTQEIMDGIAMRKPCEQIRTNRNAGEAAL